MKSATILIKTEPQLKLRAQKLAEKCGVSLSSVITHSLQMFIRDRSITFAADDGKALVPNARTAKALTKQLRDVKAGKNLSPQFSTSVDAIAYLKSVCK